jgi:hypothetical protein
MIKMKSWSLLFLLTACSTGPKILPEDIKDAFNKGPCKFGRVRVENDPELPNAGYIPAVFCANTEASRKEKVFALESVWMNYGWAAVYFDGKDHYVAVLDWTVEGGFKDVPIIESRDRGKTWLPLSKIEKPHFSAQVTDLKFDEKGNGELRMEWEPSPTEGETLIRTAVAKLYTRDFGRNWKTGSR